MKLTIKDVPGLQDVIESFGCLPAARIQEIIAHVFESAKSNGEDSCTILVHVGLLPGSYTQVPAMFGKTVARRSVYTSVKSMAHGSYIKIIGSNTNIPSTFRQQVLQALKGEDMRFRCERKDVPRSYRRRPELLARSLGATLNETVKSIKKENHIIWKIV